ncbi:Hypothetical predicted protein [Marmota monax]|uniref:Uncharacterized protein n=1 Tax=Marmota monax TaxID=9995 RepID=A0A5E4ABV9_MARMO|nr:Hypothetical predicted protein [Marmota monax]
MGVSCSTTEAPGSREAGHICLATVTFRIIPSPPPPPFSSATIPQIRPEPQMEGTPSALHKRSQAAGSNCHWNPGRGQFLTNTADLQSDHFPGLSQMSSFWVLRPLEGLHRRCPSPPPPLLPLTGWMQRGTAAASGAHPGPQPQPSPRPRAAGSREGKLQKPSSGLRMTCPSVYVPPPPGVSHGGLNKAGSAPRRGDQGLVAAGQWVMKPALRVTAQGAGGAWGGVGVESRYRAHLFSERRVGTRGRGEGVPTPTPELSRRVDEARSSSCPRPWREGDVSVHTYTHSGGKRRSERRPTFPWLPPGGEKQLGAVSFPPTESREPKPGGEWHFGKEKCVCLETPEVVFQTRASAAREAPRGLTQAAWASRATRLEMMQVGLSPGSLQPRGGARQDIPGVARPTKKKAGGGGSISVPTYQDLGLRSFLNSKLERGNSQPDEVVTRVRDPGDSVPARTVPSHPLTATGAGLHFDFFLSLFGHCLGAPAHAHASLAALTHTHSHTRTQTRGRRQVGNFVGRSQRRSASSCSSGAQAPPPGCVVKRARVSDWSNRRDNTCSTPSFK